VEALAVYSKFEQLDSDKQQIILNAALAEFSEKSYKQASTNEIVKRAGISKGILFHYFGNKKQLFIYLFDWAMGYFMDRFNREVDLDNRDVISRLWEVVEFKMKINSYYPTMFGFFQQMFVDTPPDIMNELMKTRDLLALNIFDRLFDNVDWTFFRDELAEPRSLEAIKWIFEGYGNTLIEKIKQEEGSLDVEAAFSGSQEFFGYVRKLFYKKEYQ
jgi:TetR/AcrR family transcriptional regulator